MVATIGYTMLALTLGVAQEGIADQERRSRRRYPQATRPAQINAGSALKLIDAPTGRSKEIRNNQPKTAMAMRKEINVRTFSSGFILRR